MRARTFVFISVVGFLVAVAAVAATQFRPWLERRLEVIFESKGLQHADVTISRLGLRGAVLKDVSFGGEHPLVLKNINLKYSLSALRQGRMDELSLKGVSLMVRQENGQWVVEGLEGLGKDQGGGSGGLTLMLGALVKPDLVPFDRLELGDSALELEAPFGRLSLPLNITWRRQQAAPDFSYEADRIKFQRGKLEVSAHDFALDAVMNGNVWQGTWRAARLESTVPEALPPLTGGGTLNADAAQAVVDGAFESTDKLWGARFQMLLSADKPDASGLRVVKASMPWEKGRLSVDNVWVPFGGKAPIKIILHVEHVDVGALMSKLTGDRVEATGMVSGALPVTIGRDGKITVLAGGLQADGPGTITLPPGILPEGGGEMGLVRDVLQDLQYSVLSLATSTGENGQLGIKMTIEGKNPKVYGGKPVKLNVNLTGNILEFFQQNMMLLTNPETLLNPGQDLNEKH